jgi:hypothetical protein
MTQKPSDPSSPRAGASSVCAGAPRRELPRRARVLALVAVLAACAGSGTKQAQPPADHAPAHPIGDIVEATNKPDPIGLLLSNLDLAIQRWSQLHLTGSSGDDQTKALMLDKWIAGEAHRRRSELIEQLESGPRQNRIVSAMALGFTREVEIQSPLLSALNDPDGEVVSNACLGLWLLERADTPLERLCEIVRTHQAASARSNAALCLMVLTKKGARADCAVEAARLGMLDTEPSVRGQCAIVLGNVLDRESMVSLGDHLLDPVPLVAVSCAKAITHIGKEVPAERGNAARMLVKAFDESKGVLKAELHVRLVVLSGTDRGKDPKDWMEWALRLP